MLKAIIFKKQANEDYEYWIKTNNKRMLIKIHQLISDIKIHPFSGLGKPEPLKFANKWSRRITNVHRLVYEVSQDKLIIYQCRFHY